MERLLRQFPFFRNGPGELQEALLRHARPLADGRGGNLYVSGQRCDDVYLIGNGSARVYVTGDSGRGVLLYHISPGELCPINLQAVISRGVLLADASASNDCEIACIPRKTIIKLAARFRELRDFIAEMTMSRFADIVRQIIYLTTRSVDYRIAEFLLREPGDEADAKSVILITQNQVALEIGSAREVVSRKLHDLQKIGAIELGRGRIHVRDRELLRKIFSPTGL